MRRRGQLLLAAVLLLAVLGMWRMNQFHQSSEFNPVQRFLPRVTRDQRLREQQDAEARKKAQPGGRKKVGAGELNGNGNWGAVGGRGQIEKDGCHGPGRDFAKHPVLIRSRDFHPPGQVIACPIPCQFAGPTEKADLSELSRSTACPYELTYQLSMEVSGSRHHHSADEHTLIGSIERHSHIPMLYGNWVEFDLMRDPVPDQSKIDGVVCAISNCNAQLRLKVLQGLRDDQVRVDAFGVCLFNQEKAEPLPKTKPREPTFSLYKFCSAMENEQHHDYVTEKLFTCLASGAVPLYWGAPNAIEFFPDNRSVIKVSDFQTMHELSAYLKFLMDHPEEYAKYMEWKKTGPSDEFLNLINLGTVSAMCRMCIRAGDEYRHVVESPGANPPAAKEGELVIQVRARGEFEFQTVTLRKLTYQELYDRSVEALGGSFDRLRQFLAQHSSHPERIFRHRIFQFQRMRTEGELVSTDEHVKGLSPGDQLEAALV